MPWSGLSVTPFQPNSGDRVLPTMIAPAWRRKPLTGASTSIATFGSLVREPMRVGMPRVSVKSLMVTGMPSSGPHGVPARQRRVEASAARSASSPATWAKALNRGLSRAIRARQSSIT